MILDSLILENYRVYRGPEKINFAKGDKHVTIIQGTNEVGKTTIMNSITWCLYGRELFKEQGSEDILNNNKANEMEINDIATVKVELNMIDNKKRNIKFVRTKDFFKDDVNSHIADSSSLKIFTNDDGVDKEVSNTANFIATNLPQKIREYFLFDGEQLAHYFSKDNKEIKEAVFKLAQLNLLKKADSHIKGVRNDYISKLNTLNPNLANLLREQTTDKEKLKTFKEDLDSLKQETKRLKEEIDKNEIKVKNMGEDPEKLFNERDWYERRLDKLVKSIESKQFQYTKFLVDSFSLIYGWDALKSVKDKVTTLEEEGSIHTRYKKEFLEYLLENHECICGNELSEGSESYKKIKELCDKTEDFTDFSDKINQLLGKVNRILNENDITSFKEDLAKKLTDISIETEEKTGIDKEYNEILMKIENIGNEKARDLITKNKDLKKTYEDKLKEIGKIEGNIESLTYNLRELKLSIKTEEEKAPLKTELENVISFCDNAQKEINRIYDDLEQDIHDKLQNLTSDEFKKMHWKEGYSDVSIDTNYNIYIMKKDGTEKTPNDLSAGGKLVLALSFMTALNSLSGFDLPILIDTPFGRLDEEIKENFGKYLHDYTKDKQIAFLVTGSENSVNFRKGINEYIGKQYVLEFNELEKGEFTKIKEINNG